MCPNQSRATTGEPQAEGRDGPFDAFCPAWKSTGSHRPSIARAIFGRSVSLNRAYHGDMVSRYGLPTVRYCAAIVAVTFAALLSARAPASAGSAPGLLAQTVPTPQSQATPAAIPADFDPCGGPLELLNKLGNGTACVFVRGEAAVTAQYGSANIPSNTQINFDTPLGNRTVGLSSAAHAFGYPAPTIYIGVLPRSQIAITPPSFVQVNSELFGRLTGNNMLAGGATGMKFEYKQLAYLNPTKFTMVAIDLAYAAPTGSPAFRAAGPQYTINPIVTQPLPRNFGLTLAFPINNFAIMSAPAQRGWSVTPQIAPYWQSPGGTMLAVFAQHNFQPNVTPVAFSASQLLGRHLAISVAEGGLSYSRSGAGPVAGLVTATTTAYPSFFSVGLSYLFGRSDLPAALQQ